LPPWTFMLATTAFFSVKSTFHSPCLPNCTDATSRFGIAC
jgi:hypothetical protein